MNPKHPVKKNETSMPKMVKSPVIASWRVSHFQSIRELIELPLAPLTIFSGPNSSGKSTFIKSILMVAQSLESSAWEVPLVLNGKYTHLGGFDDILHHGSHPPEIELGFVIKPADEGESIVHSGDGQITVKAIIEKRGQSGENGKNPMRVRRSIVHWGDGKNPDENRFELSYHSTKSESDEKQRASLILQRHIAQEIFNYEIIRPKSIESRPQFEEAISASLTNFLPGRVLTRVQSRIRDLTQEIEQLNNAVLAVVDDEIQLESIDWERELSQEARAAFGIVEKRIPPPRGRQVREDDYMITVREISEWQGQFTVRRLRDFVKERLNERQIRDLSRRLSGTLPEIQRLLATRYQSLQETELEVRLLPTPYNQVIQQIKRVFDRQIFYLGPLRDDPRVIYAIPSLPGQKDVGLKGEYTAAMLHTHYTRPVDYPLPPEEDFNGEYSLAQGTLGEAVQIWLNRMGLAETFKTELTSKVGYRLGMRPEGIQRDFDLTSLGVGVSQVLPIVVMSRLAPEHSVLIFEQPEVQPRRQHVERGNQPHSYQCPYHQDPLPPCHTALSNLIPFSILSIPPPMGGPNPLCYCQTD